MFKHYQDATLASVLGLVVYHNRVFKEGTRGTLPPHLRCPDALHFGARVPLFWWTWGELNPRPASALGQVSHASQLPAGGLGRLLIRPRGRITEPHGCLRQPGGTGVPKSLLRRRPGRQSARSPTCSPRRRCRTCFWHLRVDPLFRAARGSSARMLVVSVSNQSSPIKPIRGCTSHSSYLVPTLTLRTAGINPRACPLHPECARTTDCSMSSKEC